MMSSVLTHFYCNGNLVEDMESYRPGGFHPVHLGDVFSTCPSSDRPRYRVLQKLGQGEFSTVWLAQDMADHDRGVAMKITKADAVHEAEIFQRLSAGASHHGRKHTLQLLDRFQIRGPNGTHEALVTDILVPAQYLRDLRIFDAKRTSYESILALAYLNQCGIIHGDLHTGNIAFVLPGLVGLNAKAWMGGLDDPDVIPVIPPKFDDQSDSLPKYLVESADMTAVVESVIKARGSEGIYTVLIDFGSAFHVSDTIPKPRTPPYICAPEILIETMYPKKGFYNPEWVLQGDIWSLGCSIYEMVAGCRLFTGPKRFLLEEIVHLSGPLPQRWLDLLEETPKAHLENDEASLRTAAEVRQRKVFSGEMDDATPLRAEEAFYILLRSMLKIEPDSRPPPELLLESAWFDGLRGQPGSRQPILLVIVGAPSGAWLISANQNLGVLSDALMTLGQYLQEMTERLRAEEAAAK